MLILLPTNPDDPSITIPRDRLEKLVQPELIQKALDEGTPIVFRGTKCFIDEAIDDIS